MSDDRYTPTRGARLPPDLDAALMARVQVDGGKVSPVLVRAIRAYLAADAGSASSAPGTTGPDLVPLLAALEQQRQDLARIGGNLNQIAHAWNRKGELHQGALAVTHDDLRAEFTRLSSLLMEIRNAVKERL